MTDDIPFSVVVDETEEMLTEKQLVDYQRKHESFCRWLITKGKNIDQFEGYTQATAKRTANRVQCWQRWVWRNRQGYRGFTSQDDASAYMQHLATTDYTNTHLHKTQHALRRYFRWRNRVHGGSTWEPDYDFQPEHTTQPRDFLSRDEREAIRQEALDYGDIPAYGHLDPDERAQWASYVAQRVRKPTEQIGPDDWEQVNGWKFTTLIWTGLDAGLRPVEVERATTDWVDTTNAVLRIPAEDAAKSDENWIVSLTDQTADALDRWLDERENYDRYADTDRLWLTRENNPYQSKSLKRLLNRIADRVGIDRDLSWYAIRHSVGTYMVREEDLAAAQAQLRHKSPKTTMKYDQAPVEDRRDALNRMG